MGRGLSECLLFWTCLQKVSQVVSWALDLGTGVLVVEDGPQRSSVASWHRFRHVQHEYCALWHWHHKSAPPRVRGSRAHLAHTVHLFYLDNLLYPIVLLGRCPMRWCVAELVPHFTLNTLRVTLYMLSFGLWLSNTMSLFWVQAGACVFYHRSSADERVPAIVLAPSQLVITCAYNMR